MAAQVIPFGGAGVFDATRGRRLSDLSDGFRVAGEAYTIAVDHGCAPPVLDALWRIMQREADVAVCQMLDVAAAGRPPDEPAA